MSRRITGQELRDSSVLKYYRLVKQWACKKWNLQGAEFDLIMYLDCLRYFSMAEFQKGEYQYFWDSNRWDRMRKNGIIIVYRQANRKKGEKTVYELSMGTKRMISRVYDILAGEKDIPTKRGNPFLYDRSYSAKVYRHEINAMIKDETRRP